jgi:hypothetical protein
MNIDYENLKNLASVIQSLVVSIGLILGGIWTLLTFRIFALKDKAEAELQKIKREISQIEQELSQSPVIQISMQAKQKDISQDSNRYIEVDVVVENKGNKAANIKLSDNTPLTIARVEVSSENKVSEQTKNDIPIYYVEENIQTLVKIKLRPGFSESYSFIARVDQPGIYLLTFKLPVPSEDKDLNFTPIAPWWGTSRFVIVT